MQGSTSSHGGLPALSVSCANFPAVSTSPSAGSEYARQIIAAHDRGEFAVHRPIYHHRLRDGYLDARRDNRQTGLQDWYRLSLEDIVHDDDRDSSPPSSGSARSEDTMTPSTSPQFASHREDHWSSAHSDAGRSDRSSSMEDVIPPSIWRVARPAALHPVKASVPDRAKSTRAPPKPRRRASTSNVVRPANIVRPADVILPSTWRAAKIHASQAIKASANATATTTAPSVPPKPARRASMPQVVPQPTRRLRSRVSARHDPAWQAAMAATGTKISVAMGLYLDGKITVNGQHAITVPRDEPCERCRLAGKECMVADKVREKNLVSGICSYCIRQRRKCAT